MKKYLSFYFLIAQILAAYGQSKNNIDAFIDSSANELIKNSPIKSIAIGIVKDNKFQMFYYGDIGNGQKPNPTNYYEIISPSS
jgi:hypothetical protein